MNDFIRCNKVSGVYWLKGAVENISILIKLKPPDDILSLPKFEDYSKESDRVNLQPNMEEFTFKWQEKCLSSWEYHHYSDTHNCVTDLEIKYHEMIKNEQIKSNKVYTYIHDDYYLPLPSKKIYLKSKLELLLDNLNISDVGSIGKVLGERTDSMSHLLKSREGLCLEDKWTAMHVVFDHLYHNEDPRLPKQESTLLSIYHNTTQNYVLLAPDVNDLEMNPYTVDGSVSDYKYEVNVEFGELGGGEELETLLSRMYSKWECKNRTLVNFVMPPVGRTQYHVTIDLVSAEDFDMDYLYIEYTIKLPEELQCNDTLHGRTHTSQSAEDKMYCFGHLIELVLDAEMEDPPPLKLYLEAISTNRHHRTEGYVYRQLPLAPGLQTLDLTCLRPEERSWRGDERRFFLGGCNLIKDLDVLSRTDGKNCDFTFRTTGKIHMRYSVIAQGSLAAPGTPGPVSSSGSALLLGAEAAIHRYKKARARLAAATRDMKLGSEDANCSSTEEVPRNL